MVQFLAHPVHYTPAENVHSKEDVEKVWFAYSLVKDSILQLVLEAGVVYSCFAC